MAKSYIGSDSPVFSIGQQEIPNAGTIVPVPILETFNVVNYDEEPKKDDFDKAFDLFKKTVNVASITSTQFDSALATFSATAIKALGANYHDDKVNTNSTNSTNSTNPTTNPATPSA